MSNLPPIDTLRDGPLKAAIWENEGQNGPYYAVTFARTFRDSEGRLADTSAFTGADLLRLAELARQAYGRTNALRRDYVNERELPDEIESDRGEPARSFERKAKPHRGSARAPQ